MAPARWAAQAGLRRVMVSECPIPLAVGKRLWRDPDETPEGTGEVALIREAKGDGHLGDRRALIAEDGFGSLNPGAANVSHRALTGADPELPRKMKSTHTGEASELPEGDVLAQVGFDMRQDAPQHVARQATMKARCSVSRTF